MSDFYPIQDETFHADSLARTMKMLAGKGAESIIRSWMETYDEFWATPKTHNRLARSMEDLQAAINTDPAGFAEILTDSASFIAFVQQAHPNKIGDDKLVPKRYLTSPYEMTGLTLTKLKPEWT